MNWIAELRVNPKTLLPLQLPAEGCWWKSQVQQVKLRWCYLRRTIYNTASNLSIIITLNKSIVIAKGMVL